MKDGLELYFSRVDKRKLKTRENESDQKYVLEVAVRNSTSTDLFINERVFKRIYDKNTKTLTISTMFETPPDYLHPAIISHGPYKHLTPNQIGTISFIFPKKYTNLISTADGFGIEEVDISDMDNLEIMIAFDDHQPEVPHGSKPKETAEILKKWGKINILKKKASFKGANIIIGDEGDEPNKNQVNSDRPKKDK